jgi:hypothetical protein
MKRQVFIHRYCFSWYGLNERGTSNDEPSGWLARVGILEGERGECTPRGSLFHVGSVRDFHSAEVTEVTD